MEPGDEVVLFEPFFLLYGPHVALAGGKAKVVRLQPPNFTFDAAELEHAFCAQTKLVIFNTPHNPTGHVATEAELRLLASLCIQYNVVALSDEVYENVVFSGHRYVGYPYVLFIGTVAMVLRVV